MPSFEKIVLGLEQFSSLDAREIELISAHSTVRAFFAGEILFYEEEETPYWFFVGSGKLKAYKTDKNEHNVSLCSLSQGMAINDIRNINGGFEASMFATVEGVEDGYIFGIKASALELLFAQISKLQRVCLRSALESIERYQRAFFSGMILDGTGKVAFMIANDLDRFNSTKKQDIAAMLNIQPETLSRIIGKLARKGVIEIRSDTKIIDMKGLKSFYE